MTRYWIGVACRDHVMRGVAGGFAQLGHGKRSGLARMRIGDWIAYYSPRTALEGGDTVQAFTAIGEVTGEITQVSLEGSFCPYRRDVRFERNALEAPMKPLIPSLSFIKDPAHWGYPFRAGQLEISAEDFATIRAAMQPPLEAREQD
jgi:EVE domain